MKSVRSSRRFLASAVGMALVLGCGSAAPPPPPPPPPPRVEPLQIEGTVTHLQRVTLPAATEARVALVDVTGGESAAVTLVERAYPVARQLPVAFALAVDPKRVSAQARYEIRAALVDPRGSFHWGTTNPIEWNPAPKTAGVVLVVGPARAPDPVDASTYRYRCDASFSFGLEELGEDVVEVRLSDRTLRLSRVPSALGTTFTDGVNTFWRKETIANLILAGRVHNCYQRYP